MSPFDAVSLALSAIFTAGEPVQVSAQTVQPPAIMSEVPPSMSRPEIVVVDSNQARAQSAGDPGDLRWAALSGLTQLYVVNTTAASTNAAATNAASNASPPPTPVALSASSPAETRVVPETPLGLRTSIAQAAARHGLSSEILSAALARESGNFRDKYVYGYHLDGTGRGISGIDKNSHPEVSDEQAFNPSFAIEWGAAYLARLRAKNNGELYSALREYNGGANFASNKIGYAGRTVGDLTKAHADAIMSHAAKAVSLPVGS